MTSALPKFFYPVATRAGYISSTTHSPTSDLARHVRCSVFAIHVLFHYVAITCYSLTHHVILTSLPNHTRANLTHEPTAIDDGPPLSFSRQNVTTKHHRRTPSQSRYVRTEPHVTELQSTSSPQRLNYIHCKGPLHNIYILIQFWGNAPLYWAPRGIAHHQHAPHHLLHIPQFFPKFRPTFLRPSSGTVQNT
jgi:hypothetical protein